MPKLGDKVIYQPMGEEPVKGKIVEILDEVDFKVLLDDDGGNMTSDKTECRLREE